MGCATFGSSTGAPHAQSDAAGRPAGAGPSRDAADARELSAWGARRGQRGLRFQPLDLGQLWSFNAGAPIARAPVALSDGRTAVATTDGYVHSVSPQGDFEWSFTVPGAVTAQPVADDAGRVYVATSTGAVVALRPDGTARWTYHFTLPVTRGLARVGDTLYFGAGRETFAATSWGAGIFGVGLGAPLSAGPTALADGTVAVGTEDGRLIVYRKAWVKRRLEFEGSIGDAPSLAPDGTLYVIAGDTLSAIDASGEPSWRRRGVATFALRAQEASAERPPRGGPQAPRAQRPSPGVEPARVLASLVVSQHDGRLVWLSSSGEPLQEARLAAPLSRPPALAPDGRLFAATDTGRVLEFSAEGRPLRSWRLGASPVNSPVVEPRRARLLVASGDGLVAAYRM